MKYKKIPKDYIKTCIDRLTRFKPVYDKYNRVYEDIINKFLISFADDICKPSFVSLEEGVINFSAKYDIVREIFNGSIPFECDSFISDVLACKEAEAFILNDIEKVFLNSGLNLTGAIKYISDDLNLPKNIRILKLLLEKREAFETGTVTLDILRHENSLLYPVKKLVLTEGATEEILLSEFAQKLGYDFDKEGVLIIGAGGKNQVARKYYKMADEIKLPVFILLDYDAAETKELIVPKLRPKDSIYLIRAGEFEDIISLDLIIKSINANFSNNLHCSISDFDPNLKMTKNLHILFKNKGFGEYKKAEFAKMIKNYMENSLNKTNDTNNVEITTEIKEIIEKIKVF